MTEAKGLAPEETNDLVPTSVEDLAKIQTEEIVELPSFLDGSPFIAKLRRPSILRMAKEGQIPNRLSAAVDDLMDVSRTEAVSVIADRIRVLEIVAEACLVEPTYEEVKEYLDQSQIMAMWAYATCGVNALVPFRAFRELLASRAYERAMDEASEPVSGDN